MRLEPPNDSTPIETPCCNESPAQQTCSVTQSETDASLLRSHWNLPTASAHVS